MENNLKHDYLNLRTSSNWKITPNIRITSKLFQGVTWLLVYRTEKYQKLKLEIERQSKKLEKKKELVGESVSLDRSKKRKLEQVEMNKIVQTL
jgi:hypothetical protein